MCMINEMKRRIEDLETESNNALAEVGRLKAQNERLKDVIYRHIDRMDDPIETATYMAALLSSFVKDVLPVLAESPAQSLDEIQAQAIEGLIPNALDAWNQTYEADDVAGWLQLKADEARANQAITNPPENS